jgi:hypothetical protein
MVPFMNNIIQFFDSIGDCFSAIATFVGEHVFFSLCALLATWLILHMLTHANEIAMCCGDGPRVSRPQPRGYPAQGLINVYTPQCRTEPVTMLAHMSRKATDRDRIRQAMLKVAAMSDEEKAARKARKCS